jgi:hypothetical protein
MRTDEEEIAPFVYEFVEDDMNLDERSLDWESEYIPQEAKRDRHH